MIVGVLCGYLFCKYNYMFKGKFSNFRYKKLKIKNNEIFYNNYKLHNWKILPSLTFISHILNLNEIIVLKIVNINI